MSDGTETLSGAESVQPTADTQVAAVEQVEGASSASQAQETQGWKAPEGFDEHLGKALSKLPEEQREVFLALEPDGLNNVRDLVLKGVDYTQKRQKESAELRDMKAQVAELETRAKAWSEAENDPARAARLFGAMAGGVDPAVPEATPEVDFNDIWDTADPAEARELASKWAQNLKTSIQKDLESAQQESPAFKQQALSQTIQQIRQGQASNLDDKGWQRVLGSVQTVLDREGTNYLSLSPQELSRMLSPVIDYELQNASTRVAGLNPAALSGNQAASLRGSGSATGRTNYKKPGPDASTEEKLEWLAKEQGKSSVSDLYG